MNRLLMNPKLGEAEKETLVELQKHFEKIYGTRGFFFVVSSGSSKKDDESAKLVALPQKSVFNSAERFNRYFDAGPTDHWGLVLPLFHVAGLSVTIRAQLATAQVFEKDWVPAEIEPWLQQNRIAFLSLVPAQAFDLVKLKVVAPPSIKKVFVGAGSLDEMTKQEFKVLGWPLVETYGMTETCSMVAVRQKKYFDLLPDVKVRLTEDRLQIHCDSLAHSSVQKKRGEIVLTLFPTDWLPTEDRALLHDDGLEFLGRSSDYIKILGEGVSLPELRSQLERTALNLGMSISQCHLLAVEDPRSENLLVLAVENSVQSDLADRLASVFNQVVRGYEKIHKLIRVHEIPRTDLGKVKIEELKSVALKQMSRRLDDKKT